MFTRHEDFRTFLKLYPIVSMIVAIHFILWFYTSFLPGGKSLLNWGIGFNYAVAQGEYWRLLSAIFFHGGFAHVLFNSFSLVLFGPFLERLLGKALFILAYLAAGFAADVATYFLNPLQYAHLGASGAIFGLFGLYFYMVIYRKHLIDRANAQVIMTMLVLGLFMTFFSSGINITGHIFGFIAGVALGPVIFRKF